MALHAGSDAWPSRSFAAAHDGKRGMTEIAFRVRRLHQALTQALPDGAEIATLDLPISPDVEAAHFPRLCWDPSYVCVRAAHLESIVVSGVMESGVFWYKVERGPEPTLLGDGMFWGTIDRLASVVAYVVRYIAASAR